MKYKGLASGGPLRKDEGGLWRHVQEDVGSGKRQEGGRGGGASTRVVAISEVGARTTSQEAKSTVGGVRAGERAGESFSQKEERQALKTR